MKYFYLLILPILLLISACTNESGARMGLFTATAPVYAILHDDLFTGETVGYLDRSGTIDIQSAIDPEINVLENFIIQALKRVLRHYFVMMVQKRK